jgi:lactoylglutathione lyase
MAQLPVSEVHHVAINVTDLERSISFYERALGYRTSVRTELNDSRTAAAMRLPTGTTGRAAILQGERRIGQIELIQWTIPGTEEAHHAAERRTQAITGPGVLLISFEVDADDMETTFERLQQLGAECYSAPTQVHIGGFGDISAFLAEDPDGTVLEFVSLPRRTPRPTPTAAGDPVR